METKEKQFVEEDERILNIKKMENPEEVKAAIELLSDQIDKEVETETEALAKSQEHEEDKTEKSFITDEIINGQPEEIRETLAKFKGQEKTQLIETIAKSIAGNSTSPFKDDQKIIDAYKAGLSEKSDEDLLKLIVDNPTYVAPEDKAIAKDEKTKIFAEPKKIELPEIPKDDPAIKSALEKETLKRLKALYPNMPEVDSMESEAYKDWRRDLDADNPDHNFKDDLKNTKDKVDSELSRILYIQKELPNLYEESPAEVLNLLNETNLPRLKALNDNPMEVLVQDLGDEIKAIRANLAKYGLTEKDLVDETGKPMDFTIIKDDKGDPFNPIFNDIITSGKDSQGNAIPSKEIIGSRGNAFWIKQGSVARKFKEVYEDKILTAFTTKKISNAKLQKEKLKDDVLVDIKSDGLDRKTNVVTLEDIRNEQDPKKLAKIIAELEAED